MKHHILKVSSKTFQALVDNKKRCDVRKHDRDFAVDDAITFHEGDIVNGEFVYTGRTVSCQISFMDNFGCLPGYINLSLVRVGLLIV